MKKKSIEEELPYTGLMRGYSNKATKVINCIVLLLNKNTHITHKKLSSTLELRKSRPNSVSHGSPCMHISLCKHRCIR
ncbi:hypothetical protein BRADI_4g19573v3 [Brachypodium distachyon]|uniref:Uncharacterized protein n=1 Tax=Brachypodium distachyon TaxID=15368 RepID=A0A2K2CNQ7_BRADI|nr:hypothetical protein BRADI_4g19573v3 [Brachypodium distachyon]